MAITRQVFYVCHCRRLTQCEGRDQVTCIIQIEMTMPGVIVSWECWLQVYDFSFCLFLVVLFVLVFVAVVLLFVSVAVDLFGMFNILTLLSYALPLSM